jgi:hypothetical protein
MSEHLPLLTAHLASLGVEPSQPLPGWLLGGFASSSMPFETVARLWDVAFLERSSAPLVRCTAVCHRKPGCGLVLSVVFYRSWESRCDVMLQPLPETVARLQVEVFS